MQKITILSIIILTISISDVFAQGNRRLEKHNSPAQYTGGIQSEPTVTIRLSIGDESEKEFLGSVTDKNQEKDFQLVLVITDQTKWVVFADHAEEVEMPLYAYQKVVVDGKTYTAQSPYPYQETIEKALKQKNIYVRKDNTRKKTMPPKYKIPFNPLDGMGLERAQQDTDKTEHEDSMFHDNQRTE